MFWSFAIVNNRLAEIFFERKKGKIKFLGHCYVKESDYKTKREKEWIRKDTEKLRFVYRNRKYKLKGAKSYEFQVSPLKFRGA